MKKIVISLMLIIVVTLLGSCTEKKLIDGNYSGKSEADERGSYIVVDIEVKEEKIIKCDVTSFYQDGTLKGEEYGKEDGKIKEQEFYDKAQHALAQNSIYAQELVDKQKPNKVDVITGATSSYGMFKDGANKAIKKSQKGNK